MLHHRLRRLLRERQHPRAFGPDHQEAVGEAVGEFASAHQDRQFAGRDRAAQADVRVAGVKSIRLGGGLEIDAIPTIAQRRRQRVAVATPLMQHVGELGFDHPQPLVLDGRNVHAALPVAVVHQCHQPFAAGQAAAMNLRREAFVHRAQRLIDAQHQRHRVALAATARAPDVQAEQPCVVPSVADGQVHAASDRTGQVGHEVGGDGAGVGLCAVAARASHVADQAVEASRAGLGRVAVRDHRRTVAVIGVVER
ncbi:hypothetical protein R1479_04576 [Ralstonia mannitolilytica]|nr:hypothetical protein R1479_04576 [Ralstonia mannitolilytica]